jgi:hypothetical protein
LWGPHKRRQARLALWSDFCMGADVALVETGTRIDDRRGLICCWVMR